MQTVLQREDVLDLTAEPLGAGWLRRRPTVADSREDMAAGVWRTGPGLLWRNELTRALDQAVEVVLVCSFLLADEALADAMLRAAQRGVRVYVLTASDKRIGGQVREDDLFDQRMEAEHKRLLERLAGQVLLRCAEHIHAKFVVTDPQSVRQARAWLSTANFNKALQDGVELGVVLVGQDAYDLAACFNWAFWCEAEHELQGPRRLGAIRRGHPAAPPRPESARVFATLCDGTALREQVLAMIRGARGDILVSSYGLSAEHAAVAALAEAARRGVHVTVLTRPRPAVAAAVALLAGAGATVLAHDKLHAKALVVDGQALVMSANLEAHGLDGGFEAGALLPAGAARAVAATLLDWIETFPWAYRSDATRGEHLGDFCLATSGLRDGVQRVIPELEQQLAAVVTEDALALQDAPAPPVQLPPAPAGLPQRVRRVWAVRAPTLPKGATEQFQPPPAREPGGKGVAPAAPARVPYDPRRFRHRDSLYVLLERHSDVGQVREAARQLGARVVVQP